MYNSGPTDPSNSIWNSGTFRKGNGPYRLVFQNDNNLVIYDSNNVPTWATGTWNRPNPGGCLAMQDDRNLVLYDGQCAPIWNSNSWVQMNQKQVTYPANTGFPSGGYIPFPLATSSCDGSSYNVYVVNNPSDLNAEPNNLMLDNAMYFLNSHGFRCWNQGSRDEFYCSGNSFTKMSAFSKAVSVPFF